MTRFIAQRILVAIVTIWAIATITFFMAYFAPGDPAMIKFGEHSAPAAVQAWRHLHGLDLPAIARYRRYLSGLMRGDLGTSYANDQPIGDYLLTRFPVTALLASVSLAIALVVGTAIGICASLNANSWIDRALMVLLLAGIGVPNFVIAPMLILFFALKLGVLPVAGWGAPQFLILPAIVLAARPTALIGRMLRSSMIDTLHQDYIRTSRAKGLSPARIVLVHALKNAFLPVLTTTGVSFGYLLSGSFVVETIFAVPGVGKASFDSFTQRDYPMIQAITILLAAIFVVVNLVIDLLYAALDPRARATGGRESNA
jgi:peptide/nickel transport system permease protein